MEMTKMLLPTVPHTPSMANNMFFPNYTNHCFSLFSKFSKLRVLERNKHTKILQAVRNLNYRQILQTNLVTSYKLKRVASPTNEESNLSRYVNNIATNEGQRRKIQWEPQPEPRSESQPQPQLEPEPVQEMESESKPEPEPEPELIGLEPKLEPKSNSEPEAMSKSKPKTEMKLELMLAPIDPDLALAQEMWKQELENNMRYSPIPSLELNSDDEMMTSTEMFACLEEQFSEYEIPNPLPSSSSGVILRPRKLKRLNKCFMTGDSANRMWSSSVVHNTDQKENKIQRQRSGQTSASNLVNRSLLKSQQNTLNNLSSTSWAKYDHRQLPSDPCSQQIMTGLQEKEENQDAEMKALLNSDLFETMSDEDLPIFQHDQINVSEKLSEYVSQGASMMSKSSSNIEEDTSQRSKRCWRKTEESQRQNDIKKNTLSDHCYHLNQSESTERLGLEELSESSDEEEIDVVSFEKQATYLNFASAKHHRIQRNKTINLVADIHDTFTSRRPRGRPPGPSSTKRRANTQANQVSKRCRVQNHQRAERRQNYTQQDEDEAENESNQKRHMHNNMERERRVTLKNLFERLKNYIPDIAGNQKVSKVSILRNAKSYITELQIAYERLDEELTDLKRQQTKLKTYLSNRAPHRRN